MTVEKDGTQFTQTVHKKGGVESKVGCIALRKRHGDRAVPCNDVEKGHYQPVVSSVSQRSSEGVSDMRAVRTTVLLPRSCLWFLVFFHRCLYILYISWDIFVHFTALSVCQVQSCYISALSLWISAATPVSWTSIKNTHPTKQFQLLLNFHY